MKSKNKKETRGGKRPFSVPKKQGFDKNKTQNTSTGTQPTKERDIMKTLNTKHFAKKCHARLTSYVKSLKHGSTFKYVKGISKTDRTLLNIIYYRGTIGEFAVKLTPQDAEAFEIKIAEDTMFCADVFNGRVQIIPLCTPNHFAKKC